MKLLNILKGLKGFGCNLLVSVTICAPWELKRVSHSLCLIAQWQKTLKTITRNVNVACNIYAYVFNRAFYIQSNDVICVQSYHLNFIARKCRAIIDIPGHSSVVNDSIGMQWNEQSFSLFSTFVSFIRCGSQFVRLNKYAQQSCRRRKHQADSSLPSWELHTERSLVRVPSSSPKWSNNKRTMSRTNHSIRKCV